MSKRHREQKYTHPELREQIKEELKQSDKGGRPGQWSARKSQMLVQEYEKRGGRYRQPKGARDEDAIRLEEWTQEEWQTKDGEARARHGDETKRYLPKKAWEQLSDEEKEATDAAKRAASREGKQYVPNTEEARRARRLAKQQSGVETPVPGEPTKKALYEEAKRLDIPGRSKMTKRELADAVAEAK